MAGIPVQITRVHIVYDVGNNPIEIYETDDANSLIEGGTCTITKISYVNSYAVNKYTFSANAWKVSWNLDKTLVV